MTKTPEQILGGDHLVSPIIHRNKLLPKPKIKHATPDHNTYSIDKPTIEQDSGLWDQVINGTRVFTPHEGQRKIINSEARFLAAIAGTGGGKTALGPIWLMIEIQKYPKSDWMVLAPTFKILERATVPTLIEKLAGTRFEGHYVEGRYNLPDGGKIYCLSTERPEGIEGGQIRGAWLDEAGQMSHKAWIAVQGRLGLYQGRALLTTTPYAVNWLKREFMDRYKNGDEDYFCYSWSSIDNPAYSRKEYERARKTLPPAIFSMRYDGRFTRMEGRIFDGFDPDYNVRPCTYRQEKTILVGCDFNVNPMAWILCHRYVNRLEVFDEIFLRNVTTPVALNVLYEKYKTHQGGVEFYGDATGSARNTSAALSDYHLIYRHIGMQMLGRTVHFPKANPPRIDRFASTNGMLCSESGDRKLHVNPHCRNLINDLEGRFYKLGTREPSDSEDLGHMTDSLGYIVHRIWPIRASFGVARHNVIKTFSGGY